MSYTKGKWYYLAGGEIFSKHPSGVRRKIGKIEHSSTDEGEANCCLTVAAPDLLKNLKDATFQLKLIAPILGDSSPDTETAIKCAIKMYEQAIAEAEGGK